MTANRPTPVEPLVVSQADRDAAAAWIEESADDEVQMIASLEAAFARHRLQSLSQPSSPVSGGEALARRFHETYERLAPQFGYETRPETREFDPDSPNGKLMIAVCSEIASPASGERAQIVAALQEARRAIGDHWAPNDCYATGPVTGDTYRDLIECPACSAIPKIEAALASLTNPSTGENDG